MLYRVLLELRDSWPVFAKERAKPMINFSTSLSAYNDCVFEDRSTTSNVRKLVDLRLSTGSNLECWFAVSSYKLLQE